MKEQEFNKVISDLVLALEKAGAYTDDLKVSIDSLFYLKDLVLIRDTLSKPQGTCFRCSHYDNGVCKFISATIEEGIEIHLTPPRNLSVPVKVPMIFSCNLYKA